MPSRQYGQYTGESGDGFWCNQALPAYAISEKLALHLGQLIRTTGNGTLRMNC